MIDLTFEELAKSDFICIDGIEFVKVVKCKDCKHIKAHSNDMVQCSLFNLWMKEDFFCADGDKKTQ